MGLHRKRLSDALRPVRLAARDAGDHCADNRRDPRAEHLCVRSPDHERGRVGCGFWSFFSFQLSRSIFHRVHDPVGHQSRDVFVG